MAVLMRLVQRFSSGEKREFMELEAQFAALEARGVLPRGERMAPLASREPGNTLIWQARFESLTVAEQALKTLAASPEHERLFEQQKYFLGDTWVELYEILDL